MCHNTKFRTKVFTPNRETIEKIKNLIIGYGKIQMMAEVILVLARFPLERPKLGLDLNLKGQFFQAAAVLDDFELIGRWSA